MVLFEIIQLTNQFFSNFALEFNIDDNAVFKYFQKCPLPGGTSETIMYQTDTDHQHNRSNRC